MPIFIFFLILIISDRYISNDVLAKEQRVFIYYYYYLLYFYSLKNESTIPKSHHYGLVRHGTQPPRSFPALSPLQLLGTCS